MKLLLSYSGVYKLVGVSEISPQENRKLAIGHMRAVNYNSSRVSNVLFFRKLVRDLAESLDVKYVLVGELSNKHGIEVINTIAIWNGSEWPVNFNYPLKNTPCKDVVNQQPCFHSSHVQQTYPYDQILINMQAESYIGTPLLDTIGSTLGILIAIDIKPMDQQKRYLALSLLTVFASRCAAELQHRNNEAQLERRVSLRIAELERVNSNLRKNEEQLTYIAYHDNLTGLANRALFNEHLQRALKLHQRNSSNVTIMMIDLDDFKNINDTHGHAVGDLVLITVAQRLNSLLRSSDLVTRYGGDEFMLLLDGLTSIDMSSNIAQSIVNSIKNPISIDKEIQIEISCSIGISNTNEKLSDSNSLLKYADSALYAAKQMGKSQWYLAESSNSINLSPVNEGHDLPEKNDNVYLLDTVRSTSQQFDNNVYSSDISDIMLKLNTVTASVLGDEFFHTLVKKLAEILDVQYVLAGKMLTLDGNEYIQTIAMWARDQWWDNVIYSTDNSPFNNITSQCSCFHSSNIQQLYPNDKLMAKLEAESYIGIAMTDIEGNTLGTLVAIDNQAIDLKNYHLAVPLMSMLATRGAAELQHINKQHQIETDLLDKTQELEILQQQLKEVNS